MPEKNPNYNNFSYMRQPHSFIQYEVTAVTSWASDGSSLALEVYLALCCFAEAQPSQELDKVQLHSLNGTRTTDFPLRQQKQTKK